ncbi:MAG: hypothetical protein PUD52_03960 [Prevotella sp.]|nr:hypothetical protein [Prevotella sp.]
MKARMMIMAAMMIMMTSAADAQTEKKLTNFNDTTFTLNEVTTVYGIRELTIDNRARRMFSLDLTWKFNEARSKYKGTGAGKSQKDRM